MPATLVFYESAKRLAATLGDMADILGDRPAAVARELTKMHEELRRDRLQSLAAGYAEPPRGEVVVVVGPPGEAAPASADTLEERLLAALASMSARDAATAVAAELGLPRRQVYARAMTLANR